MQTIAGCILLIVAVAMIVVARPPAGQESASWLCSPWIFGQSYVLATLVVAVVGISLILGSRPS